MRVTLGVCGGVAAYKAAELTRVLQQRGVEVRVVMTQSAQQFVQPMTFAALTGHKVITGLWPEEPGQADGIEHIDAAQSTDLLLVAPATANTIAKFAHGLADDFLSTMYLATTAPVLIAPAMNVNMWRHAATQANLKLLRERGVHIAEPASGYLACGMTGEGRLAAVEEIAEAAMKLLAAQNDMQGETVLVTAGGTREAVDAVRYLGNRSSGKMGYAVAAAAARRGAKVILVSAPTALPAPTGCELIAITTAEEMRRAVLERLPEATMVIKAAAVADFRPKQVVEGKLHRDGPITLEFEPTGDIVSEVSERRLPGTLIIAFAAETSQMLESARRKLARKHVDAVVANDVSRPEIGFDSDRNAVSFVTAEGIEEFPEAPKSEIAEKILNSAMALRSAHALRHA